MDTVHAGPYGKMGGLHEVVEDWAAGHHDHWRWDFRNWKVAQSFHRDLRKLGWMTNEVLQCQLFSDLLFNLETLHTLFNFLELA